MLSLHRIECIFGTQGSDVVCTCAFIFFFFNPRFVGVSAHCAPGRLYYFKMIMVYNFKCICQINEL